jgi:hypothetical protein
MTKYEGNIFCSLKPYIPPPGELARIVMENISVHTPYFKMQKISGANIFLLWDQGQETQI